MKPITCVQCSYQQTIATRIDPEGYCVSSGWTELRDHIDAEHPEYAAALDSFLGPDNDAA